MKGCVFSRPAPARGREARKRNLSIGSIPVCLFCTITTRLHPPLDPRALHPAGDVDGVAPDVVVELRGADDAGGHVAEVEADAQHEVELDEALWNFWAYVLQSFLCIPVQKCGQEVKGIVSRPLAILERKVKAYVP